jgi:hypothetical protein
MQPCPSQIREQLCLPPHRTQSTPLPTPDQTQHPTAVEDVVQDNKGQATIVVDSYDAC